MEWRVLEETMHPARYPGFQASLTRAPASDCAELPAGLNKAYAGPRRPSVHWLLTGGEGEEGDIVTVHRRRPAGSASGPREQADAPQREQEGGGSSGGGGAGGGGGSGRWGVGGAGRGTGLPSFRLPGKMGCCGIALVIGLALTVILAIGLMSTCTSQPASAPQQAAEPNALPQALPSTYTSVPSRPLTTRDPTAQPQQATSAPRGTAAQGAATKVPAAAPVAASQPASGGGKQKWTVMLYMDGDDKILDLDVFFDMNEAESVGSNDQVNIVAQTERYMSRGRGSGAISGGKRFYLTHDEDLSRINSKVMADLGDVDMSDPKSLVDFATWAIREYPADRYVLVLSDHGMGWPGGWTDASSPKRPVPNVPLARAVGNQIYLMDLDKALADIRSRTGLEKFDLVGLDACLMSQLEVYAALAPHARYAVASEETEPALGWAYHSWLGALEQDPSITGADLGKLIVKSYIKDDERIVDDRARSEFMRQGSPMGGLLEGLGMPSAQQLAQQLGDSITLTALDLGAMPQLMQSFNEFAYALQGVRQQDVALARGYAQSFTSIFGEKFPPSYVDAGHFAALAARTTQDKEVTRTANAFIGELKTAVVAEKHGPKKPGSTGLSIYFPNSKLYRSPVAGFQSYTAIAQRFAAQSLWDSFLNFHYTGRRFQRDTPQVSVPDRAATISAPGAGVIAVSPIRLSAKTVAPRHKITMKADVTGSNVGHVYFFTGYYDKGASSINVADTDYLESPETRQLDGVYYPDWGGRSKFTLQFDWEPLMFSISDGQSSAQVLLQPASYGVAAEKAVYMVDGVYTFGDGGETRPAQLHLSNGLLRQVLGFTGAPDGSASAAAEIVPQSGDRFTVLEKWLDLDAGGKVKQEATQKGKTLTFGKTTFVWKQLDAAAGDYVVGFVVEDLDGNSTRSFAHVTVK